ncbi:MAG: type domain [Paenibacillus sp.]|nr:type domain [Paenibacillus sp.]
MSIMRVFTSTAVMFIVFLMYASIVHGIELNLALHKAVVASSESSSGPAADAVDGDPATNWRPGSADISADDKAWITVDLGQLETFSSFYVKNGSKCSMGGRIRKQRDDWNTEYVCVCPRNSQVRSIKCGVRDSRRCAHL